MAIVGIKMPIVKPGDDLAKLIVESARGCGVEIEDGDVVVVTSKVVAKALGSVYDMSRVRPSKKAVDIARKTGLRPEFVEVLLRESDNILLAVPIKRLVEKGLIDFYKLAKDPDKARKAVESCPYIFVTVRDGTLWTDSGIDFSNLPPNQCAVPPRNLDAIAKKLHEDIKRLTGKYVAVVITDTEAFLTGSIDIARGSYGITPVTRCFGEPDMYGKPKFGGIDAIVHEIAAAAALVMKQTAEGIPVVIVKGLEYEKYDGGLKDFAHRDPKKMKAVVKEIVKSTVKVLGIGKLLKALI